MTIKAVLFDFDDTLGNREQYTHKTYCRKVDETAPDLDPWTREMVIQECLIYEQHGNVHKTYVRDRVKERFGIDFGDDFTQYWKDHQWESVVVYDDAKDTLEQLKQRGYRVGIITNGDAFGQRRKVEHSGIMDLLDVLVISGEEHVDKPDPAIFEIAAKRLGLACEECAFVGDMMRNDIYGAHMAGMFPVWIWPHSTDRYCDLDVTRIYHLSDLLELFKQVDYVHNQ